MRLLFSSGFINVPSIGFAASFGTFQQRTEFTNYIKRFIIPAGGDMSESNDNQNKFFGTYFDRDSVLRISRAADVLSWVTLTIYLLTWIFTMALFLAQYFNGLYFAKGSETLLSTFSLFSPYLQQPLPGVLYFFALQAISKGLLILLDMEDNTRRAARK
jgi:hypothetical protein